MKKMLSAINPATPAVTPVRMRNAALEEQGDFIILRGVIDPKSLKALLTPDYQRGTLSRRTINELARAIKTSKVPDVELAVRGGDFNERAGVFLIKSPTYIMDGLQRISAARQVLQDDNIEPFLGATAYFNTTIPWERERFRILNAERVRVSPNVLLRNERVNNQALKLVYDLSKQDRSFVLFDRVSWSQNQKRTHVMTALVMLRTIRALHAHVGGNKGSNYREVISGLTTIMDTISRSIFTANIVSFFNVLDQCWSVRNVVYTERQPHLKGPFLIALASVLSRYINFWQGEKLVLDRLQVKKLGQFPLNDPAVVTLTCTSGAAYRILTEMITDHINSGKRTRRLVPRTHENAAESKVA